MYMKSMQQFTESLAKMKLPMYIENSSSGENGNANLDKKLQASKTQVVKFYMGAEHSSEAMVLSLTKNIMLYVDNTTIMLPVHTGSLRRTHYEVLSVSENATYNEIRESYKCAILSTHPDKLRGKHVADDPYQQEMFLSVQKAWEVISDPKSRENYDKELQASRNGVEVVDSEIGLEEMLLHVDGDMKEFFYQCRCGDYFSVATFELTELGVLMEEGTGAHLHSTKSLTQASVVLPCSSCSLKIRLTVDVIC